MKKVLPLIFLCLVYNSAGAQTDDENIAFAQNSLDFVHNCDDALRFLDKVTPAGKTKPGYLLNTAKANDCKNNNAQAIYFYNKYLELQPSNDSVKKRLAELTDQNSQQASVANQERVARESYMAASGKKKKKKRSNLDDGYGTIGGGFGILLGGDNAPYKNEFSIVSSYGFPIVSNHLVLEINTNASILFSPNNNWFGQAFNVPPSSVSGVGTGISAEITVGLMPVILNTKKLSLAIGPVAGIKYLYLPDMITSQDDYSFSSPSFSFCYGLKSVLYVGEDALFFAEFSKLAANTATVSMDSGTGNTTSLEVDIIRIGVCYKFSSWW